MAAKPIRHEADERAVHQRDRRLGLREGERTKAGALPTNENESLHLFAAALSVWAADALVSEARSTKRIGVEVVAPVDQDC